MTQEISALMDGELEAHEADRAILACRASEEATRNWNDYHLIGEAMRGYPQGRSRTAQRVFDALGKEPTVLAPLPRVSGQNRIARIALAAAASVATVAAVGWIGFKGAPGVQQPTVAQSVPATQEIQTVVRSVPVTTLAPVELTDYLAAHRQVPSHDYYPVAAKLPARGR